MSELRPADIREPTTRATPAASATRSLANAHVLLAGVGNIGSHLALQVAPLVGSLTLVDRDRVTADNANNQAYDPAPTDASPGTAMKVEVLAAQLRARNPRLALTTFAGDVRDLPWGYVREADVVFGALDSLGARQTLGTLAYRVGKTYIDGGVGDPWLGRVQVITPGQACLQCSWGNLHYRQLTDEHPCRPGQAARVVSTALVAPALLGATTAGMMAAELVRHFGEQPRDHSPNLPHAPTPPTSREINLDLLHSRMCRARLHRAASCRSDHELVPAHRRLESPSPITWQDVLEHLEPRSGRRTPLLEHRPGMLTQLDPHEGRSENPVFGQSERFSSLESLRSARHRTLDETGVSPRDELLVRPADPKHAPFFLTWNT